MAQNRVKPVTIKKQTSGKKTYAKSGSKVSAAKKEMKKSSKGEVKNPLRLEIISITVIAISFLLMMTLYSEKSSGFFGDFVKDFLVGIFGIGAYVLPFFAIVASVLVMFIKEKAVDKPRAVMSGFLFIIFISFVHILNVESKTKSDDIWKYIESSYLTGGYSNGGLFGAIVGDGFIKLFSKAGSYILFVASGLILIILISGKSFFEILRKIGYNTSDFLSSKYEDDDEYEDEEYYDEELENEEEVLSFPQHSKAFIKKEKKRLPFFSIKKSGKGDDFYKEPKNTDEEVKIELVNEYFRTGKKPTNLSPIEKAKMEEEIENRKMREMTESLTSGLVINEPNYVEKENDEVAGAIEKESQEKAINGEQEFEIPEDFGIKLSGIGIDGVEPPSQTKGFEEFVGGNDEAGEKKTHENNQSESEHDSGSTGEGRGKRYVAEEYEFPPISMLNANKNVASLSSRTQIYENSKKLEETLKSFGVSAKVVEVSKGPTVTRYELSPGMGVKVSKISGLADDLALSLAAVGIRIEAPIPGKSVVGIEIPNKEVQPVYLKEVIDDEAFTTFPSKLAFALGKDISGHTVVADIAKMPHLLIAGATGSGKSVCINTLITSIIFKSRPDEVKLLLVDPKVVELSIYNGIPHLLIPVVTDPKKAAGALNWAVVEMTTRYKLFAEASVRDLKGYNDWKLENGEKDVLPQIVIIIDELADLMMAAPGEVEDAICRLAQMARAAGIHLIIATQRPSVDVITGLIKANVPSRLAFAVSSGTDSRTILDSVGAEKLLGKGDMLFNPVGLGKPQRIQGAFISDKEVENIVRFLKENSGVDYDEEMVEKITSNIKGTELTEKDELLEESVDFIFEKEKASVSMLQRRFRVGYNRAARIMEEIEARGVVGPEDGSKPRKILMTRSDWQSYKENYLK